MKLNLLIFPQCLRTLIGSYVVETNTSLYCKLRSLKGILVKGNTFTLVTRHHVICILCQTPKFVTLSLYERVPGYSLVTSWSVFEISSMSLCELVLWFLKQRRPWFGITCNDVQISLLECKMKIQDFITTQNMVVLVDIP